MPQGSNPKTLLIASLVVKSDDALIKRIQRAVDDGATAVELRLDHAAGATIPLAELQTRFPDLVFVLTCRSVDEGGKCDLPTEQRGGFLRQLCDKFDVTAARAANLVCDLEWRDWNELASALLADDDRSIKQNRPRPCTIASYHDFAGRPANLAGLLRSMSDHPLVDCPKIAFVAHKITDALLALDLMRSAKKRSAIIAMGKAGLMSRLLAGKVGGSCTYCAETTQDATAPGQITVAEMTKRYRFHAISQLTAVYGVIGDPIERSMSPHLMNTWFERFGVDAVYLPLLVSDHDEVFDGFVRGCVERKWLGASGFSVTMPHKSRALQVAGQAADELAFRIGAANTLVIRNDSIKAYNTDSSAVVDSLAGKLDIERPEQDGPVSEFQNLPVDVLGTGGVARAAIAGLIQAGCTVTVYGRNTTALKQLEGDFTVRTKDWNKRGKRSGELVVNATSLGMRDDDDSPLPDHAWESTKLAYDLIYNAKPTKFLRDARYAGVQTLSGLDMFVRQAVRQFELWTGITPDVEQARKLVNRFLRARLPLLGVTLIGYRGSGKTCAGKLIANQLGGRHLDTDVLVQSKTGQSIASIFENEGEAGFRLREACAIVEAVEEQPLVISAGGGAVLDEANVEVLRTFGCVVWLTASHATLLARMTRDADSQLTRPALTEKSPKEEIQHLLAKREPLYRAAADIEVDTEGKDQEAVVREVIRAVQAWRRQQRT